MGILFCTVVLTTVLGQETNEAEKLFQAMEQKIVGAKTLNLAGTAAGRVGNGDVLVKVAWTFSEGNKANVECARGVYQKRHFISNGKSVFQLVEDRYLEAAVPPKDLVSTAKAQLIDLGSFYGVYMWPTKLEGKSAWTRHDFKLRPEEKIGKKTAHVVEYTLKHVDKIYVNKLKCKIWLDTETKLPLKRRIDTDEKAKFFVEELYSEFTIDGKIDPKRFEVPK